MKTLLCKNNFGKKVKVPSEKFIFRVSVYGLIVKINKILVLRNKSTGKYWFPGGGVEIGEKIDKALRREIKEETGLNVNIGKMVLFKENLFYYQPSDEAFHAFLFFFLCKPKGGELRSDAPDGDLDLERPQWIPIKIIKANKINDFGREVCALLKNLMRK